MPGLLHSTLLADAGFRHAFFTREGGVSVGAFASLNFSVTVGDEPSAVEQNLRRAAEALSVQRERLYFPSQVHEAEVVELLGDESVSDVLQRNADAVVSGAPDLACAVRIADCVPVLMADPLTGRVAAAHAGWRGLVRSVIAETARVLGGNPGGWIAAIGPHITQPAFEVSEDVAMEIEAVCPGADCVLRRPNLKPHVSLSRVARWQLEHLGVQPERIEVVAGCTHSEPERFYSFRRDGKASGRHLAAIVPRLSRSDTVR